MFHSGSPYSPFFTSGLLSSQQPRRGSLPTHSYRDSTPCRSFLSLDLPDTRTSIPDPPHSAPLRLRRSRDSIRSIPSPKPAPSMTLPDIPKKRTCPSPTPPRLPSIVISSSLGLSIESPAPLVISRTKAPFDVPSSYRQSIASTATASSSVRRVNRSRALARLEGRTRSTRHRKAIKRNFMSMTDEDSDADREDNDMEEEFEEQQRRVAISVLEPEDLVLPPPATPLYAVKSAPAGGRFPSLALTKSTRTSSTSPRKRRTKEWFPLKSFIDLQNSPDREDDYLSRWSWRSFIEVASVS